MAEDRNNPMLRLAIWEAYEQRCPYCLRWTEYESFQIDHVIPRVVFNNKARIASLAAALGLPLNFDYEGLENFIMSCRPCNRRKGGEPQVDEDLRYTVRRVRDMIDKIRTLKSHYQASSLQQAEDARTKLNISSAATGSDPLAKDAK